MFITDSIISDHDDTILVYGDPSFYINTLGYKTRRKSLRVYMSCLKPNSRRILGGRRGCVVLRNNLQKRQTTRKRWSPVNPFRFC